jgi:hypothetical protein
MSEDEDGDEAGRNRIGGRMRGRKDERSPRNNNEENLVRHFVAFTGFTRRAHLRRSLRACEA